MLQFYYMVRQFTANYKKMEKWYLGWVEEVPGVNTQGKTLKEAKNNLREALELVLSANRSMIKENYSQGKGKVQKELITLTS